MRKASAESAAFLVGSCNASAPKRDRGTVRLVGVVSPDFQVALVGLGGVFLGALISAGAQYLLAQRHEKREIEREEQARATACRQAARLIDVDLRFASDAVRTCIKDGRWSGKPLTVEGWVPYRNVIAPELSDDAWTTVVDGVKAVADLQDIQEVTVRLARAKARSERAASSFLESATRTEATVKEASDLIKQANKPNTTNEEKAALMAKAKRLVGLDAEQPVGRLGAALRSEHEDTRAETSAAMAKILAAADGAFLDIPIIDDTAANLSPMLEHIETARAALAPFVRGEAPA